MRKKLIKTFSIIVAFAIVCSIIYTSICAVFFIPNNIVLFENSNITDTEFAPQLFKVELDTTASNQNIITKDTRSLSNGNYEGTVKFLGAIPIKNIDVNVIKQTKVIPCGNSIGVKLYTDGLLVVGIADFECTNGKMVSPCKNKNIKEGDIILKVNSIAPKRISELSEVISNSDGKVILELKRGDEIITQSITLKASKADGNYKLGLLVRDSAAGIGTLTFYDPSTKVFGALGHGISDADTGKLLPVASGEILPSTIISVEKGISGRPGELRGSFVGDKKIGSVNLNCDCGLYGNLDTVLSTNYLNAVEIANKSEVIAGEAQIISNVSGNQVEKYDILITKVSHQTSSDTKGMVIKITDQRLLDMTGGIVQGMSGSPIIQNEKLVGAVTHVFVNDPTKGYGIFIENMLAEAERIKNKYNGR